MVWACLLLLVCGCGGGTQSGANTLDRGVPQDEAMMDENGAANGDENADQADNGQEPEDGEEGNTVGGQL